MQQGPRAWVIGGFVKDVNDSVLKSSPSKPNLDWNRKELDCQSQFFQFQTPTGLWFLLRVENFGTYEKPVWTGSNRFFLLHYTPIQASSVPCECLFSGSKQTATNQCAWLGTDKFENLQIMKSARKKDLVDLTAWNMGQIEEIDRDIWVYEELIHKDVLINSWAEQDGSFFDLDTSLFK